MTKPKQGYQDGFLTLSQKAELVNYAKNNPRENQDDLAKWAARHFKLQKVLHRTTVGRILKRKEEFEAISPYNQSIKRKRIAPNSPFETALVNWVLQCQHRKIRLSYQLIQVKAHDYAQALEIEKIPKFSNGWLDGFLTRNGFKQWKLFGESGDAEMEGIEGKLDMIKAKIAQYSLDDVYNMDETGLNTCMAPDRTIARQRLEGAKKDKTRITIAFTCNATGTDRFEPLFIGHSAKPRCFKKKSGAELGFFYLHNEKAWMTAIFFQQYLFRLNEHVKRKILLLMDNAPSHVWKNLDLPNIEVVPLPPNTTSKLQPMDAGIIASFKCHYRRRQLAHALDLIDLQECRNPYKIDQLTAMKWSRAAWNELDSSVMANCWKHTGLLSSDELAAGAVNAIEDTGFADEYARFVELANIRDIVPVKDFVNPADENSECIDWLDDAAIIAAAQTVEMEEEEEIVVEEVKDLYADMSRKEEVTVLSKAISTITKYSGKDGYGITSETIITELRRLQQNIRWQEQLEHRDKAQQTKLTQFFHNS
jgi:DDE superfamily endonuclease/Tc5 transposase DNA-binding domain